MKRRTYFIFIALSFIAFIPLFLKGGINIHETKLLSQPAISNKHIAFVYANDVWIADIDGQNVKRLTSHKGVESHPVLSPDGNLVAFSANYDGNTDVYIVPVKGGEPKRLTWHPDADTVCDFTPDGSAVLFTSPRFVFTRRYTQLFTVPIEGGFPAQLKIPHAFKATYSPDGTHIAYLPLQERFRQWKHYRGGTVSTIWLFNLNNYSVEKIPQPEGRCNDTDPMWIGEKIYFLSDRNGEFNLFSFDSKSKIIIQITHFDDFPVLSASAGAGKIIYERAGHLSTYDLQKEMSEKLTLGIAADLKEVRPRFVKGSRYISSASISPSGARAVFGFRGEIVTVPAKKGDLRNLTNTPGIHERFPIWSPDGKHIAYFSDESGEYELHVIRQDGKRTIRKLKVPGAGFYELPVWSPDNQKIVYTDNSQSLFWIDIKTGLAKKIASEYTYGSSGRFIGFPLIQGFWSPDSKWIVFSMRTEANIKQVYLYSLEKDKSYSVTDGMSDVSSPVFDKSGKYLYFFGSTDAGPVKQWFTQSADDMRMTRSVYLAVLKKDLPSPLAKESDEEKSFKTKKEQDEVEKKMVAKVSIDFAALDQRIIALPIQAGNYWSLQAGNEGEIFYLEAPLESRGPFARKTNLHKFDLNKRKDEVIMSGVNDYQLSADKSKILYKFGRSWGIIPASGKSKPGQGKLKTDTFEVRIDPRAEWKQMFHEAWRLNRDYFYDPNMHGADWKAMYAKYEVFLPHLACRNDLNRIIQWMCSELGVGHHSVRGGDTLTRTDYIPGGLLGADYSIENGLYRFKKVYGGLNWNLWLRAPLTEPGINVKGGEYLFAVNGKKLCPPTNLFSLFENTAGKITEITIGPNPDGSVSRTVSVIPLFNELALRNRDWVEGNLKKVDRATGGRVAYVYVPDTSTGGHDSFKRYFFPQVNKDAVIVDERLNSGGRNPDYVIDILRRPFACYWAMRYGADIKTPGASIQGPKVMIIDETAGSGGDTLPWMFRKFKLGKLIGKRTWGGLVGFLGCPLLMDGGRVTAPNLAIWTEDGWIVENVGVPPDIEVEQTPADVIAGRDPQLEKAIEVVMEELQKNPPKKIKRLPYPVKVKRAKKE